MTRVEVIGAAIEWRAGARTRVALIGTAIECRASPVPRVAVIGTAIEWRDARGRDRSDHRVPGRLWS